MRTLIVGRWNTALLAWARATGRNGWNSLFADTSGVGRPAGHFSRFVDRVMPLAPELVGTRAGAVLLAQFAAEHGAQAVIAGSDHLISWLSAERDAFGDAAQVLAPKPEVLLRMASKVTQGHLAEAAGFRVLPTWCLSDLSEIAEISEQFFPLVLRPSAEGSLEQPFKVHYSPDRDDALAFLASRAPISAPVLAQPYIHGPNLLIHSVRTPQGESLTCESFLVTRKFDGVALTLRREEPRSEVMRACLRFAELAELSGPFHFDLVLDPRTNTAYFLEANIRLGGTTDKVLTLGYDEPNWSLRAFGLIAQDPPQPKRRRLGTVVNRKAVAKHFIQALRGELTPLDYPGGSRFQQASRSVLDFASARDCLIDPNDLPGTRWCFGTSCRQPNRPNPGTVSPNSVPLNLGGVR